jgi:hypothetical protein
MDESVRPGFFLPPPGGLIVEDGEVPESPPGKAIPRLSARDGFFGGIRTPGTAGEEWIFVMTGLPFGSLRFVGRPPATAGGGDTIDAET